MRRHEVFHNTFSVEQLLKLSGGSSTVLRQQIRLPANIRRVQTPTCTDFVGGGSLQSGGSLLIHNCLGRIPLGEFNGRVDDWQVVLLQERIGGIFFPKFFCQRFGSVRITDACQHACFQRHPAAWHPAEYLAQRLRRCAHALLQDHRPRFVQHTVPTTAIAQVQSHD